MTTLEIMEALQDAHRILRKLLVELADGSPAVWNILYHATLHLNLQMKDALGDTELEVA